MKLATLLHDPGHPVAYYPKLRKICGSTNATLLCCQLLYWHGKQRDKEGWIVKRGSVTPDDPDGKRNPLNQSLEHETGLTYKEQKSARRQLKARGFLHERQDRLRHLTYFKLDLAALYDAWNKVYPYVPGHREADEVLRRRERKPVPDPSA